MILLCVCQRYGIVRFAFEFSPGLFLVDPAPLLEEERNFGLFAFLPDVRDPIFFHRTRTGAGLAADDNPVDFRQVQITDRPQ